MRCLHDTIPFVLVKCVTVRAFASLFQELPVKPRKVRLSSMQGVPFKIQGRLTVAARLSEAAPAQRASALL